MTMKPSGLQIVPEPAPWGMEFMFSVNWSLLHAQRISPSVCDDVALIDLIISGSMKEC